MLHYEIKMQTPIGKRSGWVELDNASGKVIGKLFVLGRENEISGIISSDGKCRLSGSFSSVIKKYDYQASGIANEDYIYLTLVSPEQEFIISGKSAESKEGEKNTQ